MKKHIDKNNEWIKRWSENRIGFHQSSTNPYLEKYFDKFTLANNSVFVPLCGKSVDMLWLASRVDKVLGVELAQKAIDDFLSENNLNADICNIDNFSKYSIDNIDIFVGDFFDLSINQSVSIDIFDRASLVALDRDTRKEYAKKILQILNGKILLVTLEYSDGGKKGPPFSVSQDEVYELYGDKCDIELLESINLKGSNDKLGSLDFAFEKVFLISKR